MKTATKFLFFILIPVSFEANGQGFILEDNFSSLPFFKSTYSGEKMGNALASLEDLTQNLKIHVVDQGEMFSCLPISVYRYAYTIQRALIDDETSQEIVQQKVLSALYPYKLLTNGKCDVAIHFDSLIQFNTKNGSLKYKDFPSENCSASITAAMLQEAKSNKAIKNFERIFDKNDERLNGNILKRVKEQLNKNRRPVVFGMFINTERFKKISDYDRYYVPSRHGLGGAKGSGHAMTVVGYNDATESFKIINSWGEKFGEKGYFWMKYEDFEKEAFIGFVLVLYDRESNNATNSEKTLKGQSSFFYEDKKDRKLVLIDTIKHIGMGVYELSKQDWRVKDKFQLQIGNGQSGQSIVVFSIDSKQNLNLHWPFQSKKELNNPELGMGVNDQVGTRKQTIFIPSEGERMDIEEPGDDYLCILYSNKPLIPDLPAIIRNIDASTEMDVVKKVRDALGKKLISSVNYHKDSMSFTTESSVGDTVLLILKVHSVE